MATQPSRRQPKLTPKLKGKTSARQQKRNKEIESIDNLEAAVTDLVFPNPSFSFVSAFKAARLLFILITSQDPGSSDINSFADLPLSQQTASGLKASHFQALTDVQKRAIPLALKGYDILGAARTGSGKTLAFLVPVLEKLYRAQWTEFDGLGALIISPTRELAVQIFDVLRKVGRNHAFSAGLVIGGKNLREEAERLSRMNILVCTPGRMLQHLDQTAGFDADNLQLLVLDEADRIMDMGFQSAVDALVEHLPKTRQTLMFSATQSKRVSDLARLSLRDPEYVSVHENAATSTPTTLQQHYITTPLPEKLDTLYGFIKSNLKSKIIVFLSSGKQVRFVYESFRHLQPGIPLLHLHGRQRQSARLEITARFMSAKHSCLFATDVVARGIDFPAVDWVIQVDCPEDVDTYIHRVGRTARFESSGRAVLFLDPSEEGGMLRQLTKKKIPIQKVHAKESKKRSIKDQLQQMCFQNPDLKYLGQKAFISYVKAIYLQKDKGVFCFNKLDLDGYAAGMGLPGTPQIRFKKGEDAKKLKNAPRAGGLSSSDSESGSKEEQKKKKVEVRTKYDKMFERKNQDVLSSHYSKLIMDGDQLESEGARKNIIDDDDDEDILPVKRRLTDTDVDKEVQSIGQSSAKVVHGLGGEQPYVVDSRRREKALKSKKKMLKFKGNPNKLVFDEDGISHPVYELQDEEDFKQLGPAEKQRQRFVESESSRVREADLDDKLLAKKRKREKRDKRRALERDRSLESADDSRLQLPTAEERIGDADPLALLRSLPLAGNNESLSPPLKKSKKWFQDDSADDRSLENETRPAKRKKGRQNKLLQVAAEPETLEDWETLATGLLDR